MEWRDDYATGVPQVDEQHKMLFRMAEVYRDALNDGQGASTYEELLRSLDLYARAHFGFEEGCMARHHCPAAKRNLAAHDDFVKTLARFKADYERDGFLPGSAHDLVNTIDLWLAEHICGIDAQLRRYVAPP